MPWFHQNDFSPLTKSRTYSFHSQSFWRGELTGLSGMESLTLPLSVTRRDQILEGVSRVLREILGVLEGCK